ncbi:hypothetical protein RJ640_027123 [Escallonia rubra]|uniref:Protein kinase domain-containing protein n=1 Tax=Escallonia rubra TaxID=112253 RepID=A0AA88UGX3_9ASTE|nr:hypothetical protein RJ640_027123 [Escallonia rubra]
MAVNGEPPIVEFARDYNQYVTLGLTLPGEGVAMYKANYLSVPEERSVEEIIVGIKVLDPYGVKDIYSLTREFYMAKQLSRTENIIGVHCSFLHKNLLYLVMPFVHGVSLKSLVSSSFPRGLPESEVAFVLKETLMALSCIHAHRFVHENVCSDCVFIDGESSAVKLGFHFLTLDKPDSSTVSTEGLMVAPELLMDRTKARDQKADMWSIGLLALELHYGRVPASNHGDLKSVVTAIGDRRSLDFVRKMVGSCFTASEAVHSKKMSSSLGDVIALCLSPFPSRRPTATELLDHKFFRECKPVKHKLFTKLA